MLNKSTLEEDIIRIMASLDEEGDHEETTPLEEEPIETYHVYPVSGGMVILKEEDTEPEDTRKINAIETTLTTVPKASDFPAYATCVFYLFLVLSCIAFQVYGLLNPPIANITIIPKTQTVNLTGTLQLGRLLHPVTISQSQIVPTTGKGHQDAAQAHGLITFYNGLFTSQTVQPGTILTGTDGVQVVTDQEADIPAANPPNLGQATVHAHAVQTGGKGNISSFDINTPCCLTAVKAVNTHAFSGGEDERDFQTVAKEDITSIATSLKTAVTQSMQGAFYSQLTPQEQVQLFPCTPTQTADHKVGQEATQVKVSVSETCSAVAYNREVLEQKATDVLTRLAATKAGANYSLLGAIRVSVIQATSTSTPPTVFLSFEAQGTWIYALSHAAQQQIKNLISGKTKQEALRELLSLPGIEQASIEWGDDTRLPKNSSYIHFVILINAV